MHTPLIRSFRPEDWPHLCQIHDLARAQELALAGLEATFLPLSVAAEREGLFEYQLAVAEDAGQPAAFAAMADDELAWLYVHPAHARRGLGRALVRWALTQAEGPLAAEVLQGNHPALALYQAAGFQDTGLAHGQMPGNEAFRVSVHLLSHPGRLPD